MCEECGEPEGQEGETIVHNEEIFNDLKAFGLLKGLDVKKNVEAKTELNQGQVESQSSNIQKTTTMFDNYDSQKVSIEVDFPDLDMVKLMLKKTKDIDKFYEELVIYVKNNIDRSSLEKLLS